MDLEVFELVMLRRPADAPDYSDEELDDIQRRHLGFYDDLRAAGQVVTNGPVDGATDPSLRGLAFYRTGSLEQSRVLAEDDPAVRAGRLTVEIMTWYCGPGTMSKPGRPVTLT
ncbi:MAG TPA: YciI family protein [Trebonia sp.]|nr:YciI family protein [Trebonia sp.]